MTNEILAYGNGGGAALGAMSIIFLLFLAILAIASFVFWIWGLIDVATKQPMDSTAKLIWILIMVFVGGGIAGAVWIFWGRKNMDKWQGKQQPQNYNAYGNPNAQPGAYPGGEPGYPQQPQNFGQTNYGQPNYGQPSYGQTNPADLNQPNTGTTGTTGTNGTTGTGSTPYTSN